MEQTSGMQLDVHLISDMQQSSMPNFRDLQAGTAYDARASPGGQGKARTGRLRVSHSAASLRSEADTTNGDHRRLADGRGFEESLARDQQDDRHKGNQRSAEWTGAGGISGIRRSLRREPRRSNDRPKDELPNDDVFRFSVRSRGSTERPVFYTAGRARSRFITRPRWNRRRQPD